MLAAKKPEYWAVFKSDYIMNMEDLRTFELKPERHYGDHVLLRSVTAVNPNFETGTGRKVERSFINLKQLIFSLKKR